MTDEIVDCRALTDDRLCAAMNAAFSDYVVPVTMTAETFTTFRLQRGFSAEHSFAVLADGDIAAFWFSSAPLPAYGNRAYTLSVGTDPAHRRKGLSRRLFQAVVNKQKQAAGQGLQLEVITTNRHAISAYETFGFRTCRDLRICEVPANAGSSACLEGLTFETARVEDLPVDETPFFDTDPTPQNARTALEGLTERVVIVVARTDEEMLGWIAVYEDFSVAQLAVKKGRRRQGIGSALLREVSRRMQAVTFRLVNVDRNATALNAFLDRAGAQDILRQYDMRLVF
ncbi:GNAT family N-acetyltransferase [Roseibium aggregatum]|uniref:GNAT family N-acetyltransferase n=1 Tax=Roseibium aggregatum TaxID=187304 RepID=A0A939EC97_9HYPH|nr:GNAT family N-acetyltransferase [Roseibium aggregatum]MBN9670101.1 GNAT family N-acetyltransferase [Roseibium aggregatum]